MRSILNAMRAGFVLLLILGLVLPAQMAAGKKKDWVEAVIIDVSFTKHHSSGSTVYPDQYFITFQIEDMTYVGRGMGKIKEEDWPINSRLYAQFNVKHVLGLRHTYMYVAKDSHKTFELELVSKKGPDGKELCGNFRC